MKKTGGFTLVELLLAMAFFSFILLFVTTGFIMVNRAYNKGLTVKLIQDEGRRVTEEFTRKIRVASAQGVSLFPSINCIEISGTAYYWSEPIDSSDADSPRRLYQEEGASCGSVNPLNAISMLDERVGVQFLEIQGISNTIYSMKLVLSTSETDLITGDLTEFANCGTGQGSQYCDVISFNTVVSVR